MVLLRSGEVRQWGATVPPPPASLPRAAWVAAGLRHSAAVLADGSVLCWGADARGAAAAPPRAVRAARVLCGAGWTAAFTPARGGVAAGGGGGGSAPGTPALGAGAAFGSLEQLEAAGLGALRPGAAALRALAPLVRRALEYSEAGTQERERQALAWALLRAGAGAAGPSEAGQAAELLRGWAPGGEGAPGEPLEDGTARHWTGLAQAALAEQLQRTRTMSRAETLPLLGLLALLRSASPAPVSPLRFYSDLVSRRLDVSLDYERWARGLPSICGE